MAKKQSIKNLATEVELLRSFVIGMAGEDKEGEYRPEFVRRMFKAVTEKPTHTFAGKENFLRELKKSSND